jgi:hypothetical protein
MANLVQTLGVGLGAAWTSGINLYATVAVLGLVQHFGLVSKLPGGLDALDNWWIIGVAIALYTVEFFADKIPYVDSIWDAVHTFIRVPAGAALALAAAYDMNPAVKTIAFLLGGSLALSTHGMKATTRAAANTIPEPFTNIILSVVEDIIAVGGVLLAVISPAVILFVIVVFLVLLVWLLPKIVRRIRRMLKGLRAFFSGTPLREAVPR